MNKLSWGLWFFFWEGGGSLVVLWVVLWGFFLRALEGGVWGVFREGHGFKKFFLY